MGIQTLQRVKQMKQSCSSLVLPPCLRSNSSLFLMKTCQSPQLQCCFSSGHQECTQATTLTHTMVFFSLYNAFRGELFVSSAQLLSIQTFVFSDASKPVKGKLVLVLGKKRNVLSSHSLKFLLHLVIRSHKLKTIQKLGQIQYNFVFIMVENN